MRGEHAGTRDAVGRHLPTVLFASSIAAGLLPIVVATFRAIDRGWVPTGDQAIFAIRTRDVLTEHHPLLGTRTSLANLVALPLNNLGPLLYDLLALPARLFEGGAGLALGVALLNGASVLGIAVLAHRRGGVLLGTAAMAAVAALCWSMGSELLFDPVQSQSLLLPFLAYLMLTWSVSAGDLAALPWAAGVASLLLQTHLSYAVLVLALAAWAVIGLTVDMRQRAVAEPERRRALRRSGARAVVISGVVVALAWSQTVAEQLTSDGIGNIGYLIRASGQDVQTIGLRQGAHALASVVSLPPWLLGDLTISSPPSAATAAVSFALLMAVLGGLAWEARRRRAQAPLRAIVTVAVALIAGLVTAVRTPSTPFAPFGAVPHHVRWMWPLAVFTLFVLAVCLAPRLTSSGARWAVAGFTALALVFAVLNLPTRYEAAAERAVAGPVVEDISRQMGRLEGRGTLLVIIARSPHDEYGPAVLAELQRRDIPFVLLRLTELRELGSSRRFTGDNAAAVLHVRTRREAVTGPPGTELVAMHDGLSGPERHELEALEGRIEEYIDAGRLVVKGEGPVEEDAAELFRARGLLRLVDGQVLDLDATWRPRFERYAELHRKADQRTLALYLGPLT